MRVNKSSFISTLRLLSLASRTSFSLTAEQAEQSRDELDSRESPSKKFVVREGPRSNWFLLGVLARVAWLML